MTRFDKLFVSFLGVFQDSFFNMRDILTVFAASKKKEITSLEVLPLVNALYVLHSHGEWIKDTNFQDLKELDLDWKNLMKEIDKVKEKHDGIFKKYSTKKENEEEYKNQFNFFTSKNAKA